MRQDKGGGQKLFRLFGHFSIILVLCASALSAKTFEDFKRTQTKLFTKYKDERDTSFSKYLKQQWGAYDAQKAILLYEKPKPKYIVPAKAKNIKSVGPKTSIKLKEIEEKKELAKIIQTPPKDINFDFYGSALGFEVPTGLKEARFYPQNQKGIVNFFNSAASSEYEKLINEIKKVSIFMNLNDWGIYLLVLEVSNHINSDRDESNLLSWFIFNKLGYEVKVGLANRDIVLMHYSKKTIYSTPFYDFSKKKFYVISNYTKGSVGRLYTYTQNYPEADKALDLSLQTLPNLMLKMKKKTLSFDENAQTYSVSLEYNQNLIDFMATYPQADYETYFNAPMNSRTYQSVANDLKKYIDGMRASDAINFVLHFVQKSFKYERDNEQFGREKVMFALETLYYDKSDCEDRAILFSYLIKELFGVSVVGLKYKDHMATALYIPMSGDSVKVGERKLIIADPTYINATIGQSMPKYRSKKPESFIFLKRDD